MRNIEEIRELIERKSKTVKEDAEYIGWVIHDYYYGGNICNIVKVYLDSNGVYHCEKTTEDDRELLIAIDDYRTAEEILDSLR